MPKCPNCKAIVNLEDFYEIKEKMDRKGNIKKKLGGFKGQKRETGGFGWGQVRMWVCPYCDSILGFSEYRYKS